MKGEEDDEGSRMVNILLYTIQMCMCGWLPHLWPDSQERDGQPLDRYWFSISLIIPPGPGFHLELVKGRCAFTFL